MRHTYFTQRISGTHRTRAASKSRRECGLSLIEVLVAIALLTIGVLSVIILFPAGFLTLEIAANATNADRIGQSQLEKLNAANAGQMAIIRSIYSNYDAGVPTGTPANIAPSLTQPGLPPTTPIPLGLNNDINAYRLVKGETVRVPPALSVTVNGTALTLSLYTPAFAPIVSPSEANNTGKPGVFAVHGLPWSRRSVNSSGVATSASYPDPNALLGATYQPQYLIDYTNGKIALPATGFAQTVLFQFTDGTTRTATTAPIPYHVSITVPASLSGQWIDPFSMAFQSTTGASITALNSSPSLPILPAEPMTPWVSGSDTLSRDFQCVNQAMPTSVLTSYGVGNFTADPYQYQIYGFTGTASMTVAETVTGTASNGDVTGTAPIANVGTIAFNPVGAAIKDTNGRPLMASIDYEVYDWHIISEDRTASNASNSASPSFRLSLRSLYSQTANDTFSDNTKYTGLFYTFTPAAGINNLDVTVLDLQTGTVLTKTTDYTVDYPDGVVNIVNTSEVNVPLRVFYRAREDWGVALSKAPSQYVLTDYTATSATPNYGECQLDTASEKLYFPLADLGKTVHVTGLTGTSSTGTLPSIDLGLLTIAPDSGGVARGVIDLMQANSLGSGTPFPAGTMLTTVALGQTGTVQGATVEAQVIWKEQGIWKHRELTSVIPAGTTQMAVAQ